MDISTPSMHTLHVAEALAHALEPALAKAASGTMSLQEVMESAGAFQASGELAASAQIYQQWLASTVSAYRHVGCFNLGTVHAAMKQHAEAEKAYRAALTMSPKFAQARLNLGHELEAQSKFDEALAEWRVVFDDTEIEPSGSEIEDLHLHALNNSARLLEQQKRYDESQALMRRSLVLRAQQTDVIQHYVHIRQKQCDWPVYQTVGEVTENQLLVGTSALATLSASDDPAVQLLAAQRYVHDKIKKPTGKPLHQTSGVKRSGRIKIGYLSGDLCMHAVGLLTPELFELHDRSRFEVHAFCWSREDGSAQRARILGAMDQHHSLVGLDDATAAAKIAAAGIDVIVDLQGLTAGARPGILTHRAAPIQASYLGLPGTAAVPGLDWIIADPYVMPPQELRYYTEKPIYLSGCYQVSDRRREVGAMPTRAQYELPEDAFIFCAFNNNHKFSEELFACWMRVLQQVPGSVLWLLADNLWAKTNMLRVAAEHGIAAERLIFAPRVAPPDYLARFTLGDLFLDTFPYNAGTTANDCLWMGTPILTRSGRSYISRMAGSLLTAVGLPDLITTTLADYEARAVQIGRNPARAASYKRYLNEHGRASALFDIPRLVRDLELQFQTLALAERARQR